MILLIVIVATLAIMAAMLVAMLVNQQWATAKVRAGKTSESYAEAGLNSAVTAVENDTSWLTTPFTSSAQQNEMNQDYGALSAAPTATYQVYDNQKPINYSANYDANGDGEVWVQATTTYLGRSTTVRELVQWSKTITVLPFAAAWTDTNMTLSGTSNIYAVNADGTPDTSGPPFVTSVEVGGNFAANSSTTLASPADSTKTQSVGLKVNGSVSTPGHSFSPTGGVGLLSDYFDEAHQAALTAEAQSCQSNVSTLFDSGGTAITSSLLSQLQGTSSQTYTAGSDLVMPSSLNSGNLTLSAKSGQSSTFNFKSLYVTGNLTISGNVTVNTTALYVGGSLSISGETTNITDQFGPIYCAKTISWKGGSGTNRLGVKTTNYQNSSAAPGPVFAKILSVDGDSSSNSDYDGSSGPTDLVLGNTWVDGDAGTGDVAVNFSGPSSGVASTVMCPVLATTEQTHSNGYVNFGSIASPMVYYMQCDNDGLYSNTCQWASSGTFNGLMILFEAEINISGGNNGTNPNVMGAVLEGCPQASGDTGTDLTLSGNSSICYDPAVINNIHLNSLTTTATQPVSGTWQELAGT